MTPTSNYEAMTAATPAVAVLPSFVAGGAVGEKRPYYGKCQYKTGKCFNERTLKRNGDAHSLCEEHRIKQNLIQRRSDRKYQTVHAIRRRERSQRRAVLKKQVSMAVAQQLFYEHQQQKNIGMQHQLSTLAPAHSATHAAVHHVASLAPPIQIPGKMDVNHHHHHFGGSASFLSSAEGLASPILSFTTPASRFLEEATENERLGDGDDDDDEEEEDREERMEAAETTTTGSRRRHSNHKGQQREQAITDQQMKEENASPTGIDDFAPDSFLSICVAEDNDAAYANLVPIMSTMGEKEMWTEDDIEFLQNLLLA